MLGIIPFKLRVSIGWLYVLRMLRIYGGSLATLPRGPTRVWDGDHSLRAASVPYSYSYPYEAVIRVVHSSLSLIDTPGRDIE